MRRRRLTRKARCWSGHGGRVARLTAKPGSIDHVREVLAAQVEPTRAEAGCLRYDLMQNAGDPADFTVRRGIYSRA